MIADDVTNEYVGKDHKKSRKSGFKLGSFRRKMSKDDGHRGSHPTVTIIESNEVERKCDNAESQCTGQDAISNPEESTQTLVSAGLLVFCF